MVVVGAGHAGLEAALASARMGLRTALLTINCDSVGQMSCNPAIGGVAKGQIVREIDALGGAMGVLTDATAIQFRLLNRGKGPAMHSPRAQCDKKAYQFLAKLTVERQENLSLRQEMVESIVVEDGRAVGVACRGGGRLPRRRRRPDHRDVPPGPDAHRRGQDARRPRRRTWPRSGLSQSLLSLGFELRRFKTGTPPRLNGRTIDFARLERQPGDDEPVPFSFLTDSIAAAAARLPHHLHQPGGPRDHPRQPPPGADVFRADPAARGRATARRSRTRSSGSPTASSTRSSWSPRGGTRSNTTATASRPACRGTSRRRSSR